MTPDTVTPDTVQLEIHRSQKTVCIGRIVSHVEREDERHNILLVGIKRATIVSEIDAGRCFRIAKVDVLEDLYPPSENSSRGELRSELLETFGKVIPATDTVQEGLRELLSGSMGLGPITDIIAHTLPLPIPTKLTLLGEANVDRRARRLIEFLSKESVKFEIAEASEEKGPSSDVSNGGKPSRLPFPPPFSLN